MQRDFDCQEELKKFKCKLSGTVQFSEVDSFHVVHNIKYLYWLEHARLEYFRKIGVDMNRDTLVKHFSVMVVRTEIDYIGSARFYDEYDIFTRISAVKKSSMKFENIVTLKNGSPLCRSKATLVHVGKSMTSERIPDKYRELILNFEGENVKFLD